jgi:proton-translocating NAD(P)+ transhydrogenase subunit alpha
VNIAIPKEIVEGEQRVALVPESAKRLKGEGITVRVESEAGAQAGFGNDAYVSAGAEIVSDVAALWRDADLILKIHMPVQHPRLGKHEAELAKPGAVLVGLLLPISHPDGVRTLASAKITSFSLDALPRITRAQSMDVLSSMSTVAGYKAVLLAAARVGKFFPMLVTAAGTIAPARVLVLGAGVAGLQAIATARRLGAVVEAFDVRAAAKEQVQSLGAKFLEAEAIGADAEDAGGYAKALSEEQHQRELALIHKHIVDADVVITTALIPGRPAPELITAEMVRGMKPGAVIVDLAAEAGGNCALTEPGRDVVQSGVTIMGVRNLPSTVPTHASQMFSRNIMTFVKHIVKDGALALDFEDEITGATCITRDGAIVHAGAKKAVEGGNA